MRKLKIYLVSSFFLLTNILVVNSLSASPRIHSLEFNDVEVAKVIDLMSRVTGRAFVFNDRVIKGKKITLLTKQKFTASEAYKIFEAILDINDLSLIEEGEVTRIVSSKDAKTSSTPFLEKPTGSSGSYITRIIPVKNLNIRTVRSSLAPLISRESVLVGVEAANILILRDTRENTDRFAKIVEIIDDSDAGDNIELELFPVINANAQELANLVDKIFAVSGGRNTQLLSQFKVLADVRTNNLILIGFTKSLDKIKALITSLDQKIETQEGNIRVYFLKNANAKMVSGTLQNISKTLKTKGPRPNKNEADVTIIPDIATNSLVIYADPSDFQSLENVIEQLDVIRPQVFIQALIMEVRLDKSLDFGIDWQAGMIDTTVGESGALGTMGGAGSTGGPRAFPATTAGGVVVGIVGGPISFGGQEFSSFNAFIKATQQDSEIDILSNPQILTLNNEEAEIKVGEIIPTIGSTKVDANNNTTTTIDYKEVGIALKITPQINKDNTIELKLEETSSNVIEGKTGAFTESAITTLNRSIKTKIVVDDGRTIALGGLISDEISEVESKTPCLGDIPILGWFFKFKSTKTRKTNLIIFLTPKVVRSKEELAKATEESKIKVERSREGRFRIDVSKELKMPSVMLDYEKPDEDEEPAEPVETPKVKEQTEETQKKE